MAYVFAVPVASDQKAITAEEAFFVFGYGEAGEVTPWDDESHMFIRTATKDVRIVLSKLIAVDAPLWKGVPRDGSAQVVGDLTSSLQPNLGIGILDVGVAEASASDITTLAFQAFEQRKAYFPNARHDSRDKRNVRDGHYVPWGRAAFMYRLTGSAPAKPQAKRIADALSGKEDSVQSAIEAVATGGGVPFCAMQVSRAGEGGDLSLYDAPEPCGCYYESVVATPSAGCVACSAETPCASGACRRGYCEAR